ncbi:hypothetical protein PR202_ga19448 [Eleusine coracana subsp. coracana]|uniref:C2H2-type domain-containing protein n=1 Tax=Eleusine coracana subsp. coracana TaxID=191504 RepID=A0AAV5CVB9_ELECO|nr:hypothetical protein QOZ80_4AG0308110 [Eleusine coracana subsp. coracana]GJN02126.1 hypothetical protein PR202_ga19448 [Eleusine coracana subsp. coracana]
MPPPPPSPEYKHFCRVCNKGFTCGSALGGHMRAHGASDDALAVDDDEEEELPAARSEDQWADAAAGTSAATHAYALRANPNRLVRSCQVCKNCGKEFTSWELFLEHGRCSSDDDDEAGRATDADGSSPPSLISDGEEDPAVAAAAWSKGKRSRRVKLMADDVASRRCASGEEEDLANCLVLLSSSSNADHAAATAVIPGTSTSHRHQEPIAPASRESDRRGPQLLQPISFLAPAPEPVMALPSAAATTTIQYATAPAPRGLFECKACKKVFTSHQALGGHRASHKKVKGCFAARFDTNNAAVSEAPIMRHAATTSADPSSDNGKAGTAALEASTHYSTPDAKPSIYSRTDGGDTNAGTTSETSPSLSMALVAPTVHDPPPVAAAFNVGASASSAVASPGNKKNAKMHECSVCHRLFTSGQALGGHKRCHWLTTSSTADPTNLTAVPPVTEDLVGAVRHQLMLRPMAADAAAEPALDLTIAAKQPPLRLEAGSGSFHLDVSSPTLHLQSSPAAVVGPGGNARHRNRTSTTSGHDGNTDAAAASTAAEDEADSTVVKKARLTDLKDVVRMDGEDTAEPWLQVGIGSSSSAGGGDDKGSRG